MLWKLLRSELFNFTLWTTTDIYKRYLICWSWHLHPLSMASMIFVCIPPVIFFIWWCQQQLCLINFITSHCRNKLWAMYNIYCSWYVYVLLSFVSLSPSGTERAPLFCVVSCFRKYCFSWQSIYMLVINCITHTWFINHTVLNNRWSRLAYFNTSYYAVSVRMMLISEWEEWEIEISIEN
jgi:hypothetical protein